MGDEEGEHFFWQLVGGDEAVELWRAWQAAGGTWDQFWTADDVPEEFVTRLNGGSETSGKIFVMANSPKLLELGENPYMLAMMVQVYAEEEAIPQNRAKLFAKFVGVLLRREQDAMPAASSRTVAWG